MVLTKTNNKPDMADIVQMMCLLFYTISAIFPPLRVYGNNNILSFIALILWFVIAFLRKKELKLILSWYHVAALFFVIYTAIIPYVFSNGVIGNRYLGLVLFPAGTIIYEYYNNNGKRRLFLWIIVITFFFAMITLIRTGIELLSSPYISRMVKSSGEFTVSLWKRGIGGYEFVYFTALISIPLFGVALNNRKKIIKFTLFTVYCILLVFTVMSNFFTAVIICIICALLAFYIYNSSKSIYRLLFLLFLSLAVVIAFDLLTSYVIALILDISPSGRISRVFQGTEANNLFALVKNEFLYDRFPVMLESIIVFCEHPLFGVLPYRVLEQDEFLIGFGQHSHILDTFALFGTVIGLLSIYVYLTPIWERVKKYRYLRFLSIPFLVGFFIVLIFNVATPSMAFAAYFFFLYVFDNHALFNIDILNDKLTERDGIIDDSKKGATC